MSLLGMFGLKKPLVLLVDDNQMLLDMYETFLELLGCECVKVDDSSLALARAEEIKPDLVMMDIQMPGLTGLQLLELFKLKASLKEIPVLMVTGENTIGDIETAFRLGAADYLVKPATREVFGQKVRPLLEKRGFRLK